MYINISLYNIKYRMETKREIKYDDKLRLKPKVASLKEELKKCSVCNDWIFNTVYRLNIHNQFHYFHHFCYLCIIGKNPNYKSINNTSILSENINIYK